MEGKEFKGKTVDEAIFNGLTSMGLSLDEVEIEVLQEGSKGFLGFGKSALVRLTQREEVPVIDPSTFAEMEAEFHETWEDQESVEMPRHAKPQKRNSEPRPPKQRKPRSERVEAVSDAVSKTSEVPPAIESTSEDAKRALSFLSGLFEKMGIDAKCAEHEGSDPKNLRIRIDGDDTAVLIGRRGDTLDALQYLTGLVINRDHDEYIRVMLDAEGYRQKREETLIKLAKRLANNVIRSGRPVKLEPMNPYERRILHAALQNNPRVETFSEGVDPYRRVVIRRVKGVSSGGYNEQKRGGGRPRKSRSGPPKDGGSRSHPRQKNTQVPAADTQPAE